MRTPGGIDAGYRYMLAGNRTVFFECPDGQALVARALHAKSDYMKTLFGEVGGVNRGNLAAKSLSQALDGIQVVLQARTTHHDIRRGQMGFWPASQQELVGV